jgi:hypothetical protein
MDLIFPKFFQGSIPPTSKSKGSIPPTSKSKGDSGALSQDEDDDDDDWDRSGTYVPSWCLK